MQAGHGKFGLFHHCRASHVRPVRASLLPRLPSVLVLAILLSIPLGCSQLRLPAIDPTGSRIFLPLPNTTQLDLPPLHSRDGQPGIIPNPAFVAPPTPPPCLDGGSGTCNLLDGRPQLVSRLQSHFDSPGKVGEIQLTPLRVVAPVGGEVVLLAGLCGPDGYLIKRQPLEWMLSPDSVGTFIEVGDDRPGHLTSLLLNKGPKIEKLDVDFARGRTSSKETVITRGSPNCDDDIQLREGQTWLSISSPSEGVSRITVLAPDSEIWDRRRQTATIYWVDAQWEFPAPQIRRTGETIPLVTRVTKAENLVPAEDWIVEYTIVDPSVAVFDPPTSSNKALIKVNRDGQAIANVIAAPGGRGTTPITIDVVRPAKPSDNLPRLVLGRGQTLATFSAPGLNLEAFGPEVGSAGEQLTYVASVGNPGDVPAENVRLLMNVPAGTKVIRTMPQPSSTTNSGLIWDQGVLGASRQLDVSVVLEPLQTGTYEVFFQAEGAGGLTAQSSVRTAIIEASVDVRFAPAGGIAQAEVGQTIQYEIDLENTGRQTLTDLRLLIDSDPGLPEAYQGENQVEQIIPMLQPGETRPVDVTFRIQQEGQLNARLQVLSGEQLLAEKSTSIRGLPAKPKQPDIGVNIDFPPAVRVGTTNNRATITVRNAGEVKLTDLQISLSIDPSLRASAVDNINRTQFELSPDGRTATCALRDLLPRVSEASGDFVRYVFVEFESLSPTAQGAIRVRATSAEGVEAEDTANFQAIADEVQPPPEVTPPQPEVRTGTLTLTLNDYGDPTIVGRELRYGMTVTNDQNLPDRNVRVLIRIPQGVQFRGVTSNGVPLNTQFGDNNTITLPTLQFIRPGESVQYIFVVVPQIPQLMELRAQIYSDGHPDPVEASQDTSVITPP